MLRGDGGGRKVFKLLCEQPLYAHQASSLTPHVCVYCAVCTPTSNKHRGATFQRRGVDTRFSNGWLSLDCENKFEKKVLTNACVACFCNGTRLFVEEIGGGSGGSMRFCVDVHVRSAIYTIQSIPKQALYPFASQFQNHFLPPLFSSLSSQHPIVRMSKTPRPSTVRRTENSCCVSKHLAILHFAVLKKEGERRKKKRVFIPLRIRSYFSPSPL